MIIAHLTHFDIIVSIILPSIPKYFDSSYFIHIQYLVHSLSVVLCPESIGSVSVFLLRSQSVISRWSCRSDGFDCC